jgi:hypothetical protein
MFPCDKLRAHNASQERIRRLSQGHSDGEARPKSEMWFHVRKPTGFPRSFFRHERPKCTEQEQHFVTIGQVAAWMSDMQAEEGAV